MGDFTRAKELIHSAQHAVVLTGAGISTASGIPDFRSPGTGLWEKVDPVEVASIWAFRENPLAVINGLFALLKPILEAKPNPAHLALAKLEEEGKLKACITQNIDSLHQKAGSKEVLELHGHLRTCTCLQCGRQFPIRTFQEERAAHPERPPACPCGGVLKPDVVLFGEPLPEAILSRAFQAARQSDLFLVAGSSLTVQPASLLPSEAAASGAKLLIFNRTPTPLDALAEEVFPEPLEEALPPLAD